MPMDIAAGYASTTGINQVTVLSKKYRTYFRRSIVMNAITNRNPTAIAKGFGDTVRIPISPQVRSARSAKGAPIVWTPAQGSYIDLPIEKIRTWNIVVLDVDKAQSQIPNYDAQWGQNAAKNTKEDMEEEFFADVIDDADSHNLGATAGKRTSAYNLGTAAAPRAVAATIGGGTGANDILEALLEMGAVLDEQDIPDEGRWIVTDTWTISKLKSSLRNASEFGKPSALMNGLAGKYDRFSIYQCNRLPVCANVDSKSVHPVLFGHTEAVAYHVQMDNLKHYPQLESVPGSGYFSEILYDYKTIQTVALGSGYWTPAS